MNQREVAREIGFAFAVTAVVTLVSTFMRGPLEKYVATAVGFVFLGAAWLRVWRKDDDVVLEHGLGLGGAVLGRGSVPTSETVRAFFYAAGWAAIAGAVFFIPYAIGWRFWHKPLHGFRFGVPWRELGNDAMGQLLIVALPEEAFYRGVLQTRLDAQFTKKVRFLGADLGWGIVITSAIFAAGHFATIRDPGRFAVFFPSLVFGYLRTRTKGIGASVLFHASCNMVSEVLARGYFTR